MTNWKKIIEDNREKIIEAGIEAYEYAVDNRHERIYVNIDWDGNIFSLTDITGGNAYSMMVHDGEAVQLFSFDFGRRDQNVPTDESLLIERMCLEGMPDSILEQQEEYEEEHGRIDFQSFIENEVEEYRGLLKKVLDELDEEEREECKELAEDIVETELEELINILDC